MNLKVAHLVSIQFGIFIGVVFCLVFSRSEYFRPRAATQTRKPATERATTVESISEPEDQALDMVDDAATAAESDQFTQQAASAMPTEYSPEAVEKSMAILTKLYYEQIAPRRRTTVAAVAPAYTEVVEEPAVEQSYDPAPATVAYVQPTQVVVYPQPAQFVVFSHPRRLANRCRPATPPGALASNPHRRPDGGGTHSSVSPPFERVTTPSSPLRGLTQNRNTRVSSCPPRPAKP
jgi:hypothetical protein